MLKPVRRQHSSSFFLSPSVSLRRATLVLGSVVGLPIFFLPFSSILSRPFLTEGASRDIIAEQGGGKTAPLCLLCEQLRLLIGAVLFCHVLDFLDSLLNFVHVLAIGELVSNKIKNYFHLLVGHFLHMFSFPGLPRYCDWFPSHCNHYSICSYKSQEVSRNLYICIEKAPCFCTRCLVSILVISGLLYIQIKVQRIKNSTIIIACIISVTYPIVFCIPCYS